MMKGKFFVLTALALLPSLAALAQDTAPVWRAGTEPAPTSAGELQRVEYFLDSDPGYGQAQSIGSLTVGDNMLTFDLSDAAAGAHVLYVRCQDNTGRWSTTMSRPLYIEQLQDIVYVEYFIDNDPGVGNATPLALPDIDYKAHLDFDFTVNTASLALGIHELSVRACDAFGQWTDVMSRQFEVVAGGGTEPVVEPGDLSRIEYFFDTDPGYGKGIPLQKASTGENTYEVSFDGVEPGAHLFCLRAQEEHGRWSAVLSRPLYVINPVGVAALEYFFDTDPGEGKATSVAVPADLTEPIVFVANTDGLTIGEHRLCVRAKGLDGLWSMVSSSVFTIEDAQGVVTVVVERQDGDTYNLQGKRIPSTSKGINIVDGKKVVVK